jgi:type II secretory pathway pseudopilin PulG
MLRSRIRRSGFSLAEALIAISIVGLASASLLMSTQVAFDSTTSARDLMVADGLMGFLFNEVAGLPYHDKGETAFDPILGPETGENSRATFDDLDDFNGLTMAPISDEWGIALGLEDGGGTTRNTALQTEFNLWRATFVVAYADPATPADDLTTGTSDMRSATITIQKQIGSNWTTVSTRRRVFAYVPIP